MSNKKKSDYNDNFENFNDRKNIYSDSKHQRNTRSFKNSKIIRNRKIIFSFAIIISIVVGLIGGAMIYAYKMLDSLNYQPIENNGGSSEYVTGSAQDPMILNVALFGVDKHDEADIRSRSDSIMILSLDSRHKKIKLTSLMRDMWVPIPGYKDNRINTAIALGGEPLAIKTIEHNFGIKIDRFCTVDFEGFRDIIDIIGGLDIEITAKEAHHINRLLIELDDALVKGGLKPFKSPLLKEVDGVHHMNGAQALQYARSRKVPTAEGLHDDYARTFRQRRVISLVVDKFKSSSLPQLLSVIEKVGPYINTNLKKNEIITLSKNSVKYLKYDLAEFRLPQEGNFEGQNINGASVLVVSDMNKARYDLAKFIYEDSIKESTFSKATTTSGRAYSTKNKTEVAQTQTTTNNDTTASASNMTSKQTSNTKNEAESVPSSTKSKSKTAASVAGSSTDRKIKNDSESSSKSSQTSKDAITHSSKDSSSTSKTKTAATTVSNKSNSTSEKKSSGSNTKSAANADCKT